MPLYWGWVVCVAFLILYTVILGVNYSITETIIPIANDPDVHASLWQLSWVGTIAMSLPLLAAPVVPYLSSTVGIRRLVFFGVFVTTMSLALTPFTSDFYAMFFVYGVLGGIGALFIVNQPFILLAEYFPYHHPRHVLATGIIVCAWPIAVIIFNPLLYELFSNFGWRITYSILAILMFVTGCATAATFRPTTQEEIELVSAIAIDSRTKQDGYDEILDETPVIPLPLKTQVLIGVVWFLASFLKFSAYKTPTTLLVTAMDSLGIPQDKSALTMLVLGVCDAVGRTIMSCFGDRMKGRMLHIYVVSTSLLCIINAVGAYAATFEHHMLYATALGVCEGPVMAAMYSTCSEVLQGDRVPEIFTIFRAAMGFGQLFGPNLSVGLYELTGSFRPMFFTVSAMYAVTALFYTAIIVLKSFPGWLGRPPTDISDDSTTIVTELDGKIETQTDIDDTSKICK